MRIKDILFVMISGITLISCGADKAGDGLNTSQKDWDVKLQVTGPRNNPEMEVISPGMEACGRANNGCMRFHKETGKVKFELETHARNFRIIELKICMGLTPPSPLDKDCMLPAENAMDFYVDGTSGGLRVPNTLNGQIIWAYNNDVSSFVLHDRNIEVQDYYYLIKACDSTNRCAVADPILKNKGMY